MTLRLQSVCEVYDSAGGLKVYLEVTQGNARWHAVNNFGRCVFCGSAVSRRSALIQIRKQIGKEIKLVGMSGARVNRVAV